MTREVRNAWARGNDLAGGGNGGGGVDVMRGVEMVVDEREREREREGRDRDRQTDRQRYVYCQSGQNPPV